MSHRVLLTADAARDLEDIYDYIARHDAPAKADAVLDRIEQVLANLAEFSHRGHHPQELRSLGIHEYREVLFKPYRMIYRVIGDAVYVYLIADGRRDMQTLLAHRLLDR